jgi:hypothetical protein
MKMTYDEDIKMEENVDEEIYGIIIQFIIFIFRTNMFVFLMIMSMERISCFKCCGDLSFWVDFGSMHTFANL